MLYGPIQDEQWIRFQRYARYIRVYHNGGERIDPITSAALMERTNGSPLLPRLRTLTWFAFDMEASALFLFLPPTLRTLTLEFIEGGEGLSSQEHNRIEYVTGSALRMIHTRAPDINNMHLATMARPCTMDPLSTFHRIRNLVLTDVSHPRQVVTLCTHLDDLELLDVTFKDSGENNLDVPSDVPEVPLNKLKVLCLRAVGRAILAVLLPLRSPVLHQVRISVGWNDEIWPRYATTISSHFASSLQTLTLFVEDDIRGRRREPRSFEMVFAPLYAMRELSEVTIETMSNVPFIITDADINSMSIAWPHLLSLVLPCVFRTAVDFDDNEQESISPGMFSITAVEKFAQRCPRLNRLTIPVADPSALHTDGIPNPPSYTNVLEGIELFGGAWSNDSSVLCKLYLMRIFPRLKDHAILTERDFFPRYLMPVVI